MERLSLRNESYLKAIIMLGGSVDQPVRLVDVARKLSVSKTAAGKAVSLLKDKRLAEQPHYGKITLTEYGYSYGRALCDRQQRFSSFLVEGLGIERDIADVEACTIEHFISEPSFRLWESYIDRLGFSND